MLTPAFDVRSVRLSLDGAVSQASGANVLFGHRALFVHDGHLLDVGVPVGGGFTIAVADGIPAHLTLSANAANSRHISITSRNEYHYRCEWLPRRTAT